MQHKSHTASHIQLVYMIISRVSGPPLPRGSSRRRHRAPSLATLAAKFGPKSTKPQLSLQTSPEQAQNKPCQHKGKQSPVAAQSFRRPNGPKTDPKSNRIAMYRRKVCTCASSLYSFQVTVFVWRNSSYPDFPPKRPKPLLFHPP